MRRIAIILSLTLLLGLTGGCVKKRAEVNPRVAKTITVLTLDGNLPNQTADQQRELKMVIDWMDRDIVKIMKQSGLQPVLIKDMREYRPEMGKLLVVDVDKFNAGNRAARAFVGFGAGAASLDLNYKLVDESGAPLSEWHDGVGSSMGGTYCAQTLNRRTLDKVVGLLNK